MKSPIPRTSKDNWQSLILKFAALYNILWGAWVVFFPNRFFRIFDLDLPNYPMIWQSVGMIVGAYGIAYYIAALNPQRFWPIVLVGLIGKIAGPIGAAYHIFSGSFPLSFGLNILTNDLIWWLPFTMILYRVEWSVR